MNFFNNEEDERKQLQSIRDLNEDSLILFVCRGVSDDERMHYVVIFVKIKYWYVQASFVKFYIEYSYKNAKRKIPLVFQNLAEHKR